MNEKVMCWSRTIMKYSIVFVALTLILAIVPPLHFANLQVAAELAQDTGVITACVSKEHIRIAGNAGECKSNERLLSLVSAEGLRPIYDALMEMRRQNQEDLREVKAEIRLEGQQKLDAAMAACNAKQEEIQKQIELAWAIFTAAVIASGVSVASPTGVVDMLSDSMFRNQFLQLENLVRCSQDLDGDGIPDNFAQCATCGQSLPPTCDGLCLGGGVCAPPSGEMDSATCVCR